MYTYSKRCSLKGSELFLKYFIAMTQEKNNNMNTEIISISY